MTDPNEPRMSSGERYPEHLQEEAQFRCSDCPPVGYPTDETRCFACPRRAISEGGPNAE